MSKKISLGAAIGLIAVAVTLTIAITMSQASKIYNSLLKYLPEKIQVYSQLEEIGNIIRDNYYTDTDDDDIASALAQGYVGGLKDGYSRYMSADEYSEYSAEIKGQMKGIGISYSRSKNHVKINEVYEGSPAQISGLAKGDVIVAFDGEEITNDNYDEMVQKLEGDRLSTVNLTYRHSDTEKTVSVAKGYEAQSVSSKAYNEIGYIKISDFYSTTAEQVETAVNKFVLQKAEGIVLDLRGNSSTNFEAAIDVIDVFVPVVEGSGVMASVACKSGDKTYTSTANSVNLPIIVLVDKSTLGCAELLACDLRDFGKAEIVGQTTAGMGIMQEIYELSDGSALLLSVGEIIPYKSESYNGKGVKPDYEVKNEGKVKDITSDALYLYAASILTQSDGEDQQ